MCSGYLFVFLIDLIDKQILLTICSLLFSLRNSWVILKIIFKHLIWYFVQDLIRNFTQPYDLLFKFWEINELFNRLLSFSFYFYFLIIYNQEEIKNSIRLLRYPDLIRIWNHLTRIWNRLIRKKSDF